jgi:hypothetical protein
MLPATEHRGRVFDRFPSMDKRRGNYLAEEVIPSQDKQIKNWWSPLTTDQGREGACVGHGVTTDLLASPRPYDKFTFAQANTYAYRKYKRAQFLDPWAGEAYSGTSVDAGFQAIREEGHIESWRWMTNAEQVRDAVIAVGPVVIGVNWYDDMYETRPSGLVTIGGPVVGGHCLTIIGYHPGMRIRGEDWNKRYEVFKWKNSWGNDYGNNGVGYILFSDFARLLSEQGDAAIAMGRKQVVLPA